MFRVQGSGFRVQGVRVQGVRVMVQNLRFRVKGLGHHRGVLHCPFGLEPHSQKRHPKLLRHRFDLVERRGWGLRV
jgi:hypothetical protein